MVTSWGLKVGGTEPSLIDGINSLATHASASAMSCAQGGQGISAEPDG
jgi:hypothetical protein